MCFHVLTCLLVSTESDELCSAINKKRKIRLDKGHRSGLIVTQTRLQDHANDWIKPVRCRFEVTSLSSHEGIIAVIQHLVFRKNSTTDECIDYIQFTRKDGSSSQKFCGRFNAELYMDPYFINPADSITSGTAFVDENGEMDVLISVAKERLKSDEEMDLSIVFTAYRRNFFLILIHIEISKFLDCSQVLKRDTSYRPCSEKRREFCIYSGFFKDNYINCPLPNCEDEQGCSQSQIVSRKN